MSVDTRSYKKIETFNYFVITLEKIMEKFDDIRLMLKNTWGGKPRDFPPQDLNCTL